MATGAATHDTQQAQYRSDQIAYFLRVFGRQFEARTDGVERTEGRINGACWAADFDRMTRAEVLMLDSLMWALEQLQAGKPDAVVLAFRALTQAHEYRGQVGGYWPLNGLTGDCATFIRNTVETALGGRYRS